MTSDKVIKICPACHNGFFEVRPMMFCVRSCKCGAWFRHEVTGHLTPCNEKGHPLPPKGISLKKKKVSPGRNLLIVERWLNGEGPSGIAADHNITRQRVEQVVGKYLMKEHRAGRLAKRG